jgi:hypothetical protein
LSAAALQTLLGLADEELLTILDSDPIAVITGEEDLRPEVRILLQLLQGIDGAVLRRWVRTGDPSPLQLLLQHDFASFEDALTELNERGFIIRKRS